MYKGFNKGECYVSWAGLLFGLIYRLLADYAKIEIPFIVVFIVMFITFGYLFFNRVVMLAIDAAKIRKAPYETFLTIEEILDNPQLSFGYKYFIGSYRDAKNKKHTKEIYEAFSLRKWKVGQMIKIKVSKDEPERIIIPSSDIALAVIRSLIGIAAEAGVAVVCYCNFT